MVLELPAKGWKLMVPKVRPLGEGTATTPVFLPGESHGQRSPVGYSLWGHTESDTTKVT